MLISTSAMAEWTVVVVAEDGSFTGYADLSSIRKTANGVRMWSLYDDKTPKESSLGKVLSTKNLKEYDCNNERGRTLSLSVFSGNMGTGNVVFNIDITDEWEYIAPGSSGMFVYEAACGKR